MYLCLSYMNSFGLKRLTLNTLHRWFRVLKIQSLKIHNKTTREIAINVAIEGKTPTQVHTISGIIEATGKYLQK